MPKIDPLIEDVVRSKFKLLSGELDERSRRLWGAAEALGLGYGGVAAVARATGMTPERIRRGIAELGKEPPADGDRRRIRRKGAGRKPITESFPLVLRELDSMVEPTSRGDPESSLRWTCKSLRALSGELQRRGIKASRMSVSKLLKESGYSLQGNRKTQEGASHPDRNAQFEYINERAKQFMEAGDPAISVDCKKKELVGNFFNSGREYQPKGNPERVSVHDFPDADLGKVAPYGVYDMADNVGWVNVGVSHETAAFAVESIRRWWSDLGLKSYPTSKRLFISADAGGSNGYRRRQWKTELQQLCNETRLEVTVSHLPPGTSKWNKIEHRLFCHITRNWRGRPLTDHRVIVQLISNTTTKTGLTVHAELDLTQYEKGVKIDRAAIDSLNMSPDEFHGEWNYTIRPQ